MKLVYVAGPYRSTEGLWGVHVNIEEAKTVARRLWRMGAAVICPHANSAYMDASDDPQGPENPYLRGDLLILARCDAIILLPRWQESAGARGEYEHAQTLGLPCLAWESEFDAIQAFLHT